MTFAFSKQKFYLFSNIAQSLFSVFQWLYERRFNLIYLPLIILSWLCYEIKFTSPVCPFYSGKRISTLLSNCNFVYRSYRPPIFIFSSYLQWIYMCIFAQLKLFAHSLNSHFLSQLNFFKKYFYFWISYFSKIIIKTPIFNRIFDQKVFVAHREIIESFGRSPTILDWYLPPWLVKACPKCKKPKPLQQFISINPNKLQLVNKNSTVSTTSLQSPLKSPHVNHSQNTPDKNQSGNIHDPSIFSNMRYNVVHFNLFPFRKSSNVDIAVKNSPHEPRQESAISRTYQEFYFDDHDLNVVDNESDTLKDEPPVNNIYTEYNNKNFANITRGIILILPDYNMPYNICNQHCGCICNAWDSKRMENFNSSLCNNCQHHLYRDACSFHKESPCLSLTKLLISDVLKAGFICVEIHLNINMGIPIHIQGKWLGMTAYPFSIYGNSISDLDCAIGRISTRYPNLPIQVVGFSGGGNILIEYLLRSHESKLGETIGNEAKMELFPTKESTDAPKDNDSSNQVNTLNGTAAPVNSKATIASITYSDVEKIIDSAPNRPRGKRMLALKSKLVNKINEKFKTKFSVEQESIIESLEYVDNFVESKNKNVKTPSKRPYKTQLSPSKKKSIKQSYTKPIKVVEKTAHKSKLDEKFKVYYNNLIKSAVFVNLNLKSGGEFFQFGNFSQKQLINKKYDFTQFFSNFIKKFFSKIFVLGNIFPSYKKSCRNEFVKNIKILLNRIHCSRSPDNLDRSTCKSFKCCHSGNGTSYESQNVYSLLTLLHNEFSKLYIESLIDPQTTSRSALLPVNNPNWTLTLGDGYYYRFAEESNQLGGLFHPTDDIDISTLKKQLRKLYDDNIKLSRNCIGDITLPILLISSLDNSLYGINDIDVYEPIRNSNILHVVTQTGGDCTFLYGTYIPTYWLKDPLIEFAQSVLANKPENWFEA